MDPIWHAYVKSQVVLRLYYGSALHPQEQTVVHDAAVVMGHFALRKQMLHFDAVLTRLRPMLEYCYKIRDELPLNVQKAFASCAQSKVRSETVISFGKSRFTIENAVVVGAAHKMLCAGASIANGLLTHTEEGGDSVNISQQITPERFQELVCEKASEAALEKEATYLQQLSAAGFGPPPLPETTPPAQNAWFSSCSHRAPPP